MVWGLVEVAQNKKRKRVMAAFGILVALTNDDTKGTTGARALASAPPPSHPPALNPDRTSTPRTLSPNPLRPASCCAKSLGQTSLCARSRASMKGSQQFLWGSRTSGSLGDGTSPSPSRQSIYLQGFETAFRRWDFWGFWGSWDFGEVGILGILGFGGSGIRLRILGLRV